VAETDGDFFAGAIFLITWRLKCSGDHRTEVLIRDVLNAWPSLGFTSHSFQALE